MQNSEQLTPMQSTVIFIENKPMLLIKLTKNVELLLQWPYFLRHKDRKILLPRRITNYFLENGPLELLVPKEELVEAVLLAWTLLNTTPELNKVPCPSE